MDFLKYWGKICLKEWFHFSTIITFLKQINLVFLPEPNVMQAFTKLLNYIFSALFNNESVLLIMLDISKAYDCIDYKIQF